MTADQTPTDRRTARDGRATQAERVEREAARDEQDGRCVDSAGRPLEDHDRGLLYDLGTLSRRRALGFLGGAGALAALAACGSGSDTGTSSGSSTSSASSGTTASTGSATGSTSSTSSTTTADATAADATLTEVDDETAGPFPGDGSNGPDVLDDSGIVRSDITASFGSSTTKAEGVPLTIKLTVRDASTGSARAGAAVYLWHCDREGRYSLYDQDISDENYLRGVQEADASGTVTFTSIYPAAYPGRWPHIHFEVYASTADATSSGQITKTSQIALPQEACAVVYATTGYEQSVGNLARTSLQQDMVFGNDGGIHQIASMSGDVSAGYTAALTIGV